jgi:hypothetical protein
MAERKLTSNQTRLVMEKRKITSKSIKKKHPGGRPSKYKPEYVEQVYDLAAHGYTDKEIADFFKVREQTINNWKNAHPEFFESLKRGKYEFDTNVVEKSLLRRATGYKYKEITRVISKEPDPETGEARLITVKEVTKEMAPDPTSMIFWLKNRQPDEWRDRQSTELGLTSETLSAILAGLPPEFAQGVREELAKLVAKGRNKKHE